MDKGEKTKKQISNEGQLFLGQVSELAAQSTQTDIFSSPRSDLIYYRKSGGVFLTLNHRLTTFSYFFTNFAPQKERMVFKTITVRNTSAIQHIYDKPQHMRTSILFLIISLYSLTCAITSTAQPKAVPLHSHHEMGTLLWQSPRTTTFEVTNAGSQPLYILNAAPDCGCTNVSWTTDAIAPGASGFVQVTFDAALLGKFHKQIEIFTNEGSNTHWLTISGRVAMDVVYDPADFPYHIGSYFLNTDILEFDDVHMGEEAMQTFNIYNASDKPFTPTLMHLPRYLTATFTPEVIRPGTMGRVKVWFNANKAGRMGLTQTSIYLSRFPGDKIGKNNEIFISAVVLPNISKTDTLIATTPRVQLSSTRITLDGTQGKRLAQEKLTLTNIGGSPLEIMQVQVFNPGLRVRLRGKTLSPGESRDINISTIAHQEKKSRGRSSILLLTNDPTQPKIVIDVEVKR